MRIDTLLRVATALTIVGLIEVGDVAGQEPSIRLEFQNGTVTLVARNATLGAILERWAQVGATTIVNAGSSLAVPVSIELDGVPERAALTTLLRGLPGYLLADRQGPATGRSQIDRIVLLASRTIPAPPQPLNLPSAPPPTPGPVQVSGIILPDPNDISTDGLVNTGATAGSDPPGTRSNAIAPSVPSRTPGFTGAATVMGSARPGVVAAPAQTSPSNVVTPTQAGSSQPGPVPGAPAPEPYRLPPPFVPEP